ncbi:MAG: serpin family protein [Candidatus Marinimicrobia bacterium]|nr:serpin family protein [Candidatus Neomarinimicrobiota bacterium]
MKRICILLALLLVLASCQLFSFLGEKATGNLYFETELDDDTPSAVSVIYENSKGEIRTELLKFASANNGLYTTNTINLNTDNYTLKQFLVINSLDSIIAAAPVNGSSKASEVSEELPINFRIEKDETYILVPEILPYSASDTPETFGYNSETVNVISLYDDFGRSINNFSFDLIREIIKEDSGNVFISPVSMMYAFGLLYPGSGGETTQSLRDVFYLNDFPEDAGLYQLYKDFGTYLTTLDEGVNLSLAHAFWYKAGYHPTSTYLNVLDTYFNTEVSDMDFTNTVNAAEVINQWAADHTNNKIKNIVDPSMFSEQTAAVLANATYFLGKWINGFNKSDTESKIFYTQTDESTFIECSMMRGGASDDPFNMDYYANSDIQIICIPFKDNSRYEMTCIMPKQESCDKLLMNLDDDQWNTWMNLAQATDVILELPKFKESYKYEMNNPLKALGLTNLFIAPDLNGMFEDLNDLFVSKVLQDTYISVDESGAEAAAVTVIIINRTSIGPEAVEVKLDHPFIYAIQDTQTNAIIFLGVMSEPTIE